MSKCYDFADDAELVKNLRPRASSRAGFLGETEDLREVIEADNQTLIKAGVTHEQIADKLTTLIEKLRYHRHSRSLHHGGGYSTSDPLVIDGIQLTSIHWMGYQHCPICHSRGVKMTRDLMSDCDYTMLSADQELRFSELIPHLIADHHFFEGYTSYRADPSALIEILQIKPGIDYSPRWEEEERWLQGSGGSSSGKEPFDKKDVYKDYQPLLDLPAKRVAPKVMAFQDASKLLLTWEGHETRDKHQKIAIDDITVPSAYMWGTGWAVYDKKTVRFVRNV
jgi:hypothetical protein